MAKIEKEELSNLTNAVRGGVGLAGYHGGMCGGMCDAFRDAVEYQFMCGVRLSCSTTIHRASASRQVR
jgi:type 1 glutamine amidotransferase